MSRRRPRRPSAEDQEIWKKVARTATPMPGRKPGGSSPEPDKADPPPTPQPTSSARLPAFRVGERATSHGTHLHPGRTLTDHLADAPIRMDHGTHRKMLRGKLKPDARLDLHGQTLAQAHAGLTDFILRSHAKGQRLVLVITGKGKDRDDDGPIPIRRGVLRHQVPNWLQAPPLGAVVLEVRQAHMRHGGEGAYYVYLKRPR